MASTICTISVVSKIRPSTMARARKCVRGVGPHPHFPVEGVSDCRMVGRQDAWMSKLKPSSSSIAHERLILHFDELLLFGCHHLGKIIVMRYRRMMFCDWTRYNNNGKTENGSSSCNLPQRRREATFNLQTGILEDGAEYRFPV